MHRVLRQEMDLRPRLPRRCAEPSRSPFQENRIETLPHLSQRQCTRLHVSECGSYIILACDWYLRIHKLVEGAAQEVVRLKTGPDEALRDEGCFIRATAKGVDRGKIARDDADLANWSLATVSGDLQVSGDRQLFVYVDPDTSLLCLSAYRYASQAQEAERLFYLVPPDRIGDGGIPSANHRAETKPPIPTLYKVAAVTKFGIRIVAVYHDTVILYSIPPNALRFSSMACRSAGVVSISRHPWLKRSDRAKPIGDPTQEVKDQAAYRTWLEWWPTPDSRWRLPKLAPQTFPLLCHGRDIGSMHNMIGLTVQVYCDTTRSTMVGLAIWGFDNEGAVSCWTAGTCKD
ncbi:hypothetical protein ANO11243_072610 [Dothideomycetidae sp. 11243]|nr:hypothetical protein ANO11243_072610 [fungal sp. No.11243]